MALSRPGLSVPAWTRQFRPGPLRHVSGLGGGWSSFLDLRVLQVGVGFFCVIGFFYVILYVIGETRLFYVLFSVLFYVYFYVRGARLPVGLPYLAAWSAEPFRLVCRTLPVSFLTKRRPLPVGPCCPSGRIWSLVSGWIKV